MLKAVILAAGMGTRLSKGHERLPKPLSALDIGCSLFEYQLRAISQYISLEDLYVVVGYRKEEIMRRFPDLHYVTNTDFAIENTAKSLLKAAKNIKGDLLWMNGDVVFRPTLLQELLHFGGSTMVVNTGPVDWEGVKYSTDGQGHLLNVSKTVQVAEGEAIGINLFKAADVPLLLQHLESCLPSDYFEKAIEGCIQEGMEVKAFPVKTKDSIEIDFQEDLDRANEWLKAWPTPAPLRLNKKNKSPKAPPHEF